MASIPRLQFLVPEIKKNILSKLDPKSLVSTLMSCKGFYEAYQLFCNAIHYDLAIENLGDSFPLAIAHYAADHVDWKAEFPFPDFHESMEKTHWFGRNYFDRKYLDGICQMPVQPTELTLPKIAEMVRFKSIVKRWAYKYVKSQGIDTATLTVGERRRVMNALYQLDIIRELYPFTQIYEDMPLNVPCETLFHYLSPWEHQIIVDLSDFLQKELRNIYNSIVTPEKRVGEWTDINLWVTAFGLRGLNKLRPNARRLPRTLAAIEAGQNWPLRGELYCVGCLDGGTYLRPAGGNLAFRIPNIDHILARFPRDDDGPCAMWFYRLHAKKRDIALDIETDKQWWDRARIEAVLPGVIPKVEELQEEALQGEPYDASMFTPDDEIDYPREIGY